MKKANNIAIIKSVSSGANEYTINGVRYTVESRFVPYDIKSKQTTFHDKIKRITSSYRVYSWRMFADWNEEIFYHNAG